MPLNNSRNVLNYNPNKTSLVYLSFHSRQFLSSVGNLNFSPFFSLAVKQKCMEISYVGWECVFVE